MRANDTLGPWGLAVLRVVVGFVFLMHGWQKLFEMGVGNVGAFFGSLGIPAAALAAVVVSLVEVVGGAALILGVGTRVAGAALTLDMLGAIFFVHHKNGFWVSDGGVELVLVLAAAALCLALTGPGALALDRVLGLERGGNAATAVPGRA